MKLFRWIELEVNIQWENRGTAAHRVLGPQARAATISFDVKFISASTTGDVLLGTAKVLKKTRSLVFMQGEIRCGERLISTAEGIWKVL